MTLYINYKYQNYTIAFTHGYTLAYDIIKAFYSLNNSIYCTVQLFEKKDNFIKDITENKSIIDALDRFFLICSLKTELIII